jgi:hypothetical protein
MKIRSTEMICACALYLIFSTSAGAALTDRGGGMIYDTDLNITWLADANYAKTSGYSATGLMDWVSAATWAGNLVYGGYNDWRLPITNFVDMTCSADPTISIGYNCTGSEMGHLFYSELGGTAGNSILTSNDPDLALFQNIQSSSYFGRVIIPFRCTLHISLISIMGTRRPIPIHN